MEGRMMLSTIVVNTLADPATPTAGVTSLREAIAQAASTSGDVTITFANDLSGPVDLSQGQLVVADSSGSVTIEASSGVTTIDAGGPAA
jgi:CSLREA domain-containing protein